MTDFTSLLHSEDAGPAITRVPVIGLAQAGRSGFFDDAGYPVSTGWDTIDFPNLGDANAYALEICGDSMEPVYREGDIVIVSPNAAVLPGDRVIAKTTSDEVLAKELVKTSVREVRLASINAAHAEIVLSRDEVVWISRIVWVSQ
jgi:phage repressor protein C with HTH and peptisase S24 domain